MKVKDLIKQLKELDQDLNIEYYNQAGSFPLDLVQVLKRNDKPYLALETYY